MRLVKSKFIAFNQITDLNQFINNASKVDGEVLLQKDYYIVNGKSILGVMSIDVSKGVNVVTLQMLMSSNSLSNSLKS